MTSKFGKNKEVAHRPQASVSLNLFVKEIEKGIRQGTDIQNYRVLSTDVSTEKYLSAVIISLYSNLLSVMFCLRSFSVDPYQILHKQIDVF